MPRNAGGNSKANGLLAHMPWMPVPWKDKSNHDGAAAAGGEMPFCTAPLYCFLHCLLHCSLCWR